VRNALPGQQAVLTITNLSKTKSLFRHGMTPVVRWGSKGGRLADEVLPALQLPLLLRSANCWLQQGSDLFQSIHTLNLRISESLHHHD
jgi:hypothetical protein